MCCNTLVESGEIEKNPVIPPKMEKLVGDLITQINGLKDQRTEYISADSFFKKELANLGPNTALFQRQLAECEAEKQTIQSQSNSGVSLATLQPQIDILQTKYSEANRGLRNCRIAEVSTMPDFKQLFETALERYLNKCLNMSSQQDYPLDTYKKDMQTNGNQAKEDFCQVTHDWIVKKGRLVSENSTKLQSKLFPSVFPWCVTECKAQAIQKCRE